MPTYSYKCPTCSTKFELVCPIREYRALSSCPTCHQLASRDYVTDWDSMGILKEPVTLGMLAERNSNKLSSDAKKEMLRKQREYLKTEGNSMELPAGASRLPRNLKGSLIAPDEQRTVDPKKSKWGSAKNRRKKNVK
jgi:putative FmdB family regulatory protein